MQDWQVEQLNQSHQRGSFRCGQGSLDDFIQRFASQYERRNLGRTYVAVRPGEKRIVGYYTLSAGAIPIVNVPSTLTKKLPRHPIPVALLARLAVDCSVQGQGIGKLLMLDALERCSRFARELAIHAIEVHAIDDSARQFYEKFGFAPLLDSSSHLFLPIGCLETGAIDFGEPRI